MLTHAVRRGLVPAVIALSAAACAGSEAAGPAASTSTPPVVPTPPVAPALALSTDSVVVSLIAGADRITQEIEITAGTSAAVSGLTVSEPIFASGQTTGWITATIASQTAPAKLSVSINPGALVAASTKRNSGSRRRAPKAKQFARHWSCVHAQSWFSIAQPFRYRPIRLWRRRHRQSMCRASMERSADSPSAPRHATSPPRSARSKRRFRHKRRPQSFRSPRRRRGLPSAVMCAR